MPVRQVSIRYEFPAGEQEREWFKSFHALSDRRWVSTAIVDGRQRMKFARIEEYEVISAPSVGWNEPKPLKPKLQKYPGGQDSKGRAEWDR